VVRHGRGLQAGLPGCQRQADGVAVLVLTAKPGPGSRLPGMAAGSSLAEAASARVPSEAASFSAASASASRGDSAEGPDDWDADAGNGYPRSRGRSRTAEIDSRPAGEIDPGPAG
jgi:hypothetical protein